MPLQNHFTPFSRMIAELKAIRSEAQGVADRATNLIKTAGVESPAFPFAKPKKINAVVAKRNAKILNKKRSPAIG